MTAPSASVSPILDDDRLRDARARERIGRRFQLLELALGLGYFLLLLASGASVRLGHWAASLGTGWWGTLALYNAGLWGGYLLFSLPLSYLSDFRLNRRYGLLTQSLGGWMLDQLKGLAVGAVIGYALLAGLYGVLGRFPSHWWLGALAGYLAFSLVAVVLVPIVIMPLFHRFEPLEDPALVARLETLAARANTRVGGVYRWGLAAKSTQANAALTGFGATRRIIVSDTMLDQYEPDEIEAVVAHELGHQVHGDIGRFFFVNALIAGVGLWLAQAALQRFAYAGGLGGLSDVANEPLILLVFMGVSLVAMPLVNGYSRRRETAADAYALALAPAPERLASALVKLARQNLADPEPAGWVEWFWYSHPALGKRVRRIRAIAGSAAPDAASSG